MMMIMVMVMKIMSMLIIMIMMEMMTMMLIIILSWWSWWSWWSWCTNLPFFSEQGPEPEISDSINKVSIFTYSCWYISIKPNQQGSKLSKKNITKPIPSKISVSALWDWIITRLSSNQTKKVSNPEQRQFLAGEFADGLTYNPPSYRWLFWKLFQCLKHYENCLYRLFFSLRHEFEVSHKGLRLEPPQVENIFFQTILSK